MDVGEISSEMEAVKKLQYKLGQKVITDKEFNDGLAEKILELKEIVANKPSGIVPAIFVISGMKEHRKNLVLMMPDMPMGEDKYAAMRMLGEKLVEQDEKPIAIFMVSEAWMKSCGKDEEFDKTRAVSSYSDKKEIACVAGLTLDGRSNFAMLEMVRDKNNKIIELGKETVQNYKYGEQQNKNNLLEEIYKGFAYEYVKKTNPKVFEEVTGQKKVNLTDVPPETKADGTEPVYKIDFTPKKQPEAN